jgi:hypothetical protein
MIFPSGESLPLCWTDSHYRQKQAQERELVSF